MPQHMRMNWEWKASALPCPCQHLPETCRGHRAGALGEKDIAPFGLLTSEPAQIADLAAAERVHARHSVLEPLHVHETLRKVDLIPAQRAEFRRAEAMPIRDQDHRRIAVPVPAAIACGFPEQLDLFEVRYSRGRRAAFGCRAGGTVPFTVFGTGSPVPCFAWIILALVFMTVPFIAIFGTVSRGVK